MTQFRTVISAFILTLCGSSHALAQCPIRLDVVNDGPQPIWVANDASTGQGTAVRVENGFWRSLINGQWRPVTRQTDGGDPNQNDEWYYFLLEPGESTGDVLRLAFSCQAPRQYKFEYFCDAGPDDGERMYDYFPADDSWASRSQTDSNAISIGARCDASPASSTDSDPTDTAATTNNPDGGESETPPRRTVAVLNPNRPGGVITRNEGRDADRGSTRPRGGILIKRDGGHTIDDDEQDQDPRGFVPGEFERAVREIELSCPSSQSVESTLLAGDMGANFNFQIELGNRWADWGAGGGQVYFEGATIGAERGQLVCRYNYTTNVTNPTDSRPARPGLQPHAQFSMEAMTLFIESDHSTCTPSNGFNRANRCNGPIISSRFDTDSWNGSSPLEMRDAEACQVTCEQPVIPSFSRR
jgi:hypothetical protein